MPFSPFSSSSRSRKFRGTAPQQGPPHYGIATGHEAVNGQTQIIAAGGGVTLRLLGGHEQATRARNREGAHQRSCRLHSPSILLRTPSDAPQCCPTSLTQATREAAGVTGRRSICWDHSAIAKPGADPTMLTGEGVKSRDHIDDLMPLDLTIQTKLPFLHLRPEQLRDRQRQPSPAVCLPALGHCSRRTGSSLPPPRRSSATPQAAWPCRGGAGRALGCCTALHPPRKPCRSRWSRGQRTAARCEARAGEVDTTSAPSPAGNL